MNLNPHLDFNGQCEEAFRLYEQCLGGRITTLLTYGKSPLASTFPELADKIMHATLVLGEDRLTGVDLAPAQYKRPQGFTIQLNLSDTAEAQRIYDTLSSGGTIKLPLQQTFWADLFAVLPTVSVRPGRSTAAIAPDRLPTRHVYSCRRPWPHPCPLRGWKPSPTA